MLEIHAVLFRRDSNHQLSRACEPHTQRKGRFLYRMAMKAVNAAIVSAPSANTSFQPLLSVNRALEMSKLIYLSAEMLKKIYQYRD